MGSTEQKLASFLRELESEPDASLVRLIKRQAAYFRDTARKARDKHAANEALAAKVCNIAEKHLTNRRKRNG